jgi:hypothetical protein
VRWTHAATAGSTAASLSLGALSDYGGGDELAVAAAVVLAADRGWLAIHRRTRFISRSTDGLNALDDWRQNPTIYEHREREWVERARAGYVDSPAIPTGGSIAGGRSDAEWIFVAWMDAARRAAKIGVARLAGSRQCRVCGRVQGPRQFRDRRVCRRCEAEQRRVRG